MSQKPDHRAIASWACYDFANTIFSMNVISLYFALWVTVDHGGQDILYSGALSISMIAVAVSVPIFGVNRKTPISASFSYHYVCFCHCTYWADQSIMDRTTSIYHCKLLLSVSTCILQWDVTECCSPV